MGLLTADFDRGLFSLGLLNARTGVRGVLKKISRPHIDNRRFDREDCPLSAAGGGFRVVNKMHHNDPEGPTS